MLKRTGKLTSKAPLKRGNSTLKKTTHIRKVGKKSQQWLEARQEVIEYFQKIGLPQMCEARLENCTNNFYLTLAHSKKRRNIQTEEDLKQVCIMCSTCHSIVESWKEAHMEHYIKQIIEKRNNKLDEGTCQK